MCSTPKANSKTNESPASSCSKADTSNCSLDGDDVNVTENSSPNAEHTAEILPEEISNGSSPEEVNDLGEYEAIKKPTSPGNIYVMLAFHLFWESGCHLPRVGNMVYGKKHGPIKPNVVK